MLEINVTRRNGTRNCDTREIVGTTTCHEYIEERRVRWFGHLMRKKPAKLPLCAYNCRRTCYRAQKAG